MNHMNRPGGYNRMPPLQRRIIRKGNGIINSLIGSTLTGAGIALGSRIGNVLSESVDKLADETVNNLTEEMRLKNEQKRIELSENKMLNNLPAKCPHCGAPTVKKLVCDYCNCKVVENL